jgi:hypothetical protein
MYHFMFWFLQLAGRPNILGEFEGAVDMCLLMHDESSFLYNARAAQHLVRWVEKSKAKNLYTYKIFKHRLSFHCLDSSVLKCWQPTQWSTIILLHPHQ